MSIQFFCSSCGQPIEVDDEHADQTAACPYCDKLVRVPRESTYRPDRDVIARPASDGHRAVPLPPPGTGAADVDPRRRAAISWGNYALFATVLALVLFGVGLILAISVIPPDVLRTPFDQLTDAQKTNLQNRLARHPGVVATQLGAMFFALVGTILALVSLTQAARRNWRGIVALAICGSFLLCNCGVALSSLGGGLGAG